MLLDLRGRSPVTEFFIIATGTSPRQMRTVAEEIQELGKKMGFRAWQTSGMESAKWILVDCVNLVLHIFDGESRDFYDLELLWGDCPRIDWRKELGLPPVAEGADRVRTRTRFGQSAGGDEMDAEEEDAQLDGRDIDDEEEGDEDEELDSPIVTEFPDESTGSNSVEFVEVDPPATRRKRGRDVYPMPIANEDDEEESGDRPVSLGGASESLDEDDEEREAEARADGDVEGVSDEDLPRSRMVSRPMGGVSAGMSSTTIEDDDEDQQRGDPDFTESRGRREGLPRGRSAGRAKAAVVKKAAPKKVSSKKVAAAKKPAKKAPLKRAKPAAKKSSGKGAKAAKPKAATKTKAKSASKGSKKKSKK